jgi:hypothetical protein
MLVGSFVENGSVRRAAELRWSEFSALKPFFFYVSQQNPVTCHNPISLFPLVARWPDYAVGVRGRRFTGGGPDAER